MARGENEGFDHTQYKDEVIERWGKDAYERGDKWYRSLSDREKQQFQQEQHAIAGDFAEAKASGETPESDLAQGVAKRQFDWITVAWQGRRPSAEAFRGLGQMYVDDSRFTANYDQYGEGTAEYVRDAMKAYADRNLE